MAAISTPEEIRAARAIAVQPQVDELITAIEAALRATTGPTTVYLGRTNRLAIDIVLAAYTAKGWSAIVHYEQRDGDYIEIKER